MSSFCPNYSRIVVSSPTPTGKRLLSRLRCKSWACEYCGDIQARMWRAHVLDCVNQIADESRMWSFVTITASGKDRTASGTLRQVQRVWRVVTQIWRQTHRAWGLRVPEYVRTYEPHADGAVHLHAIVAHESAIAEFRAGRAYDRPAAYRPLRGDKYAEGRKYRLGDISAAHGGGYQCLVERFRDPNAGMVAGYLTKYLTKEIQSGLSVPQRFRRIQCSEGFSGFGEMGESELSWEQMTWVKSLDYAKMRADGVALYDLQEGRDVQPSDFHNLSEAYPIN